MHASADADATCSVPARQARDEMRTEEVTLAILRIVQSYPADDVTLPVLDAALEAIAHSATTRRASNPRPR